MAYRPFLYPISANYTILQFLTNKGQIRLKPCVCMAAWVTKALLIYRINQSGLIRPGTDSGSAIFHGSSYCVLRPRFSSESCHCHKSVSECLAWCFYREIVTGHKWNSFNFMLISCRFGMTWGYINNDRIVIFWQKLSF